MSDPDGEHYADFHFDPRQMAATHLADNFSIVLEEVIAQREEEDFDFTSWREKLGLDEEQFHWMTRGYKNLRMSELAGIFYDLGMEIEIVAKPRDTTPEPPKAEA